MTTANKQLPEISVSQAQKEVTHNTALNIIDALLLLTIQDASLHSPPASGTNGTCYIPATTASGLWAGHENEVAHYYNDTWHFYTPWYGWYGFLADENKLIYWNNSAWVDMPAGSGDMTVTGIKISAAADWFGSATVPDAPAITASGITDSTGGIVSTTLRPYDGDWEDNNDNFATVAAELNRLKQDVSDVRLQLNDLLAQLRISTGCGVIDG